MREDKKTQENTGSDQSVTGDSGHFIQSVYQILAYMGLNPNYIQTGISDPGGESKILFGVPETKVGVAPTGNDYQWFVDNDWTIVALNVEQLRNFHRVIQTLQVIAVQDQQGRAELANRKSKSVNIVKSESVDESEKEEEYIPEPDHEDDHDEEDDVSAALSELEELGDGI